MSEFDRRYSEDIMKFSGLNFKKVEPASDSEEDVPLPKMTRKERREHSERLMARITAIKKRSALAREGMRANPWTIPGMFGPNGPYNDGPNS
jgi:hypothetical protein